MTHVCVLQYAGIFVAALLGAALGTVFVLRLWKTGELDVNAEPPTKNDQ